VHYLDNKVFFTTDVRCNRENNKTINQETHITKILIMRTTAASFRHIL